MCIQSNAIRRNIKCVMLYNFPFNHLKKYIVYTFARSHYERAIKVMFSFKILTRSSKTKSVYFWCSKRPYLFNQKHNVGWLQLIRFVDLVRAWSLHIISRNHPNTSWHQLQLPKDVLKINIPGNLEIFPEKYL